MKICVYIDINDKDYEKYEIRKHLTESIEHILTDIKSRALFIEKPIIYKDEFSKEYPIK